MKLFTFFLFLALLGVCLAAPAESGVAVGEQLEEKLGTDLTEQADHEVVDTSERVGEVSGVEELEDEVLDPSERLEDVSDIDEIGDDEDIGLDISERSGKRYCKYYSYHCYRLKCKKIRVKFPYKYGYRYKYKLKCFKKFFWVKYKPSCLWKKKCYCYRKCKYYY